MLHGSTRLVRQNTALYLTEQLGLGFGLGLELGLTAPDHTRRPVRSNAVFRRSPHDLFV